MPVKKLKRGKKAGLRPRKTTDKAGLRSRTTTDKKRDLKGVPSRDLKGVPSRVVATAPTRDVIINITTGKTRAPRKAIFKPTQNRNEDLNRRIKDFELTQGQFRATEMIKQQALKLGILDKRLSVLTDIIDNERVPPIETTIPILNRGFEGKPFKQEEFERGRSIGPKRGRPVLSEDEKRARANSRLTARQEGLTNPVIGEIITEPVGEIKGKGSGGGDYPTPYADLVGASGLSSRTTLGEERNLGGAEEQPKLKTKRKTKLKYDPSQVGQAPITSYLRGDL